MKEPEPLPTQLGRALVAVGTLIAGVRDDQWSEPTPCAEWTVRDVVNHVIAMNLVFTAILNGVPPPERGIDRVGADPVGAYRSSASELRAAFEKPGVLERHFEGPLGTATGEDRLQIRLYDLLAHGWDLARATGQPVDLPEDVSESALSFARIQLSSQPRTGRFGPAQKVSDDALAADRLAAFLGRPIDSW